MNMTFDFSTAEANAVDLRALRNEKALSTNFIDIVTDCCGDGAAEPKTRFFDRFPLLEWLMGTNLTAELRAKLAEGICGFKKNDQGKYEVDLPATFWSTIPESDEEACCWPTMDFAKCSGKAQLEMLCLKDCKDIQDDLMWELMRVGRRGAVSGIASENDTLGEVNERIARLSMAFYTANTAILGTLDNTTPILKPFHGLLQVMENPAVAHILGGNVLEAFDSWACRMALLGGRYSDYVIAIHPLLKETMLRLVTRDRNGNYPDGWSRDGEDIRFHGIRFIEDYLIPVDFETGTTEAWILNSDAVGIFLGGDLQPRGRFVRYSGHEEMAKADGCGQECTFYYNIGAVVNNNATRIANIVDIPLSGVCLGATGDLRGLMQPQTIAPKGVVEVTP